MRVPKASATSDGQLRRALEAGVRQNSQADSARATCCGFMSRRRAARSVERYKLSLGSVRRREVGRDGLELFERCSQILGDFGSDDVRLGQTRRVFLGFVFEPEDIEADLVALEQLVVLE